MQDTEAEFARRLRRYRSNETLTRYAFGTFVVSVAASIVLGAFDINVLNATAFVAIPAWFVGVIAMLYNALGFHCPRCSNGIFSLEEYCPECGAHGLATEHWWTAPYCPACDKHMVRASKTTRQSFRWRCCSHCGALLASDGITKPDGDR